MNMTVTNLASPATSPTQRKSSLPADPSGGETFKFQDKLPKLPIPELETTAEKYLAALQPLQVSITVRKRLCCLFANHALSLDGRGACGNKISRARIPPERRARASS